MLNPRDGKDVLLLESRLFNETNKSRSDEYIWHEDTADKRDKSRNVYEVNRPNNWIHICEL